MNQIKKKSTDFSVKATSRFVKGSVRKLLPVALMIKNTNPKQALEILKHMPRACAKDFYSVLFSCIANAENNHNKDIDSLRISNIYLGKSLGLKRFSPRARGSAAGYKKYFSRITIELSNK